jgi:hypothetical protein
MTLFAIVAVAALGAGSAQEEAAPSNALAEQIVAACVAPADRERALEELGPAAREALLACSQARAADALRERLPMQVDEVTTMESIAVEGTMLVYTSRIALDRSDLREDAAQILDQSTRTNVCSQEDMAATLSYGGAYAYVWLDRSGNLIHRAEIRSC